MIADAAAVAFCVLFTGALIVAIYLAEHDRWNDPRT